MAYQLARTKAILATLLLFSAFLHPHSYGTEPCSVFSATLQSAEGKVVWKQAGKNAWQSAQLGQSFCTGDTIKVETQRAALRLANHTLVRLQQSSVIKLLPEKRSFWVEITEGAAHFLTRTPKKFTVKAPYLNAAVDGTEFLVTATANNNHVTVFEGQVSVDNDFGAVTLTDGMQSSCGLKSAPQTATKIRLRDAAEWALYYPPLIVNLETSTQVNTLIHQERYLEAMHDLQALSITTTDTLTLQSSLALALGQNQQAFTLAQQALKLEPNSPTPSALMALITLVKGNEKNALQFTQKLINKHPKNISVILSHTYSLQGNGKIKQALAFADKAHKLMPNNIAILARLAELALSNDQTRRAKKLISQALTQAPNNSRLNTLSGFIELNQLATQNALQFFNKAISSNSADSLSHLGKALALIQLGELEKGRKQMELAVLLDPSSSILRSYLGKTYFEGLHNDWSATQYQLAKNLDPNDPTPWFYEAHLKQEQNRFPEALRLITTAIEKNDNRAVYRSRMLLDSDAAARSANQAGIYQELGFDSLAIDTAALAVSNNPTDFATHQALALAYGADSSAYRTQANEALLTKIFQPIGAKALNIGTGTIGIQALPWLSPSKMGTNEHSSLFIQRGISGYLTSFAGTQDTLGYEWQLQTTGKNTSINGGQYSYSSAGFRENNGLNEDITEIAIHHQLLSNVKLFAQHTSRDQSSGDLTFGILSESFDPFRTDKKDWKINELGAEIQFNSNNTIIAHIADSKSQEYLQSYDVNNDITDQFQSEAKNTQNELAYLFSSSLFNTQLGYQHTISDGISLHNEVSDSPTTPDTFILNYTQNKLYFHLNSSEINHFRTTLGIAYSEQQLESTDQVANDNDNEYRLGLLWNPLPNITFNIVKWKTISKQNAFFGSIEQTHILNTYAKQTRGFFSTNDNIAAQLSWRSQRLSGSFKSQSSDNQVSIINDRSIIDSSQINNLSNITQHPLEVQSNYASINFIINNSMTVNALIESNRTNKTYPAPKIPKYLHQDFVNLKLTAFVNSHVTISVSTDYIDQKEIYSNGTIYETPSPTLLFNTTLKIKFPKKYGEFKIVGRNIFDEPLSLFQGQTLIENDITNPTAPNFSSRRSINAVLSLFL